MREVDDWKSEGPRIMNKTFGGYRRYVFCSGEAIYKKSDTVPWYKEEQADWVDALI